MTEIKSLENWTIPPVVRKSPYGLKERYFRFPRLKGDTIVASSNSHVERKEIFSSRIERVDMYEDRSLGPVITVTTKSGSQYYLNGLPDPSFWTHCQAMGIDTADPSCFQQLVEKLQ